MIKKISGYILVGIGAIGYYFFKSYRGQLIPYPFAFFLTSIGIAVAGILLVLSSRKDRERAISGPIEDENARLKARGEKILLNYDHCEFRSSDYREEIQNESQARSYDVLFNQDTKIETRHIESSRLVYTNKVGDLSERFISQPLPVGEISLKASVLDGQAWLYVDRFDRSKYYFEIK